MDDYPELSVHDSESQDWTSSRHDSASSVAKPATTTKQAQNSASNPEEGSSSYHSFPSPSTHSSDNSAHRTDSNASSSENSKTIEAEYARYTDAPPPFTEKQYEGKTEGEQNSMRMTDYAKEISRMMGRQLVRGLKIDEKNSGAK